MNKKGVEWDTVLIMISFVLISALVFIILSQVTNVLKGETNKEVMQTWVQARTATKGIESVFSAVPPITDLEEPLVIKNEKDLVWAGSTPPKAYEEIANSMVDCWSTFDKGESDFLNSIGKENFCFPCRAIAFSPEIKRDKVRTDGFLNYLNKTKTTSQSSPTYIQYLANDNTYSLDETDLEEDYFVADKDLYVLYYAASGRGTINFISTLFRSLNSVKKDLYF